VTDGEHDVEKKPEDRGMEVTASAPQIGVHSQTPQIDSRALMSGGRKLLIDHEGEIYTLQVTRQGKLLLTK
jgi:hemin uptake protein HemP